MMTLKVNVRRPTLIVFGASSAGEGVVLSMVEMIG
jgi:hypothetical protein